MAVRFGEEFSKAIKSVLPDRAAFVDPFFSERQAGRLDAARADPPELFGSHEPAGFEDLEVLNDCGQSDSERHREVRNRGWSAAQPLDDGSARRITKSVKDAVQIRLLPGHAASPSG